MRACQAAGLRLVTATTDNGPEFGKAFGDACRAANVRQHRIPPRTPNLNAFVERFQGTVLHLHHRVAFRYRYYGAADIDADLEAFPALLQLRAAPPRLPDEGQDAREHLLRQPARHRRADGSMGR